MAAYKDEARGTWYVSFPSNDWTGKNKRKLKLGFRTRKEALAYEQKFLLQQATNLEMNYANFYKLYEEDLKPKLKLNTWRTKNVIFQNFREEERKVIYDQYYGKSKDIVTGIVQRYIGNNVSINLGKVDAVLRENEMIPGETFEPTDRIKVYVMDEKSTSKGPKVLVSRTHPELVKRLFEAEVAEVRDGIVEIKSFAREAGSRT